MTKYIGIDIGSQKTMLVRDDAEIILTDTGSVSRPTLISFFGRTRLIGEEAIPQLTGDNTVPMINKLIGSTLSEINSLGITKHFKCKVTEIENGVAAIEVSYSDELHTFDVTSIFAMILSKLVERIIQDQGDDVKFAISIPIDAKPSIARAIKESFFINGVDYSLATLVTTDNCLIKAYQRKLLGIRESEKTGLQGKKVLLIDMGHTKTTIIVVEVNSEGTANRLAAVEDSNLGAFHFDLSLFDHFASICKSKNGTEILPGSKRGMRLLYSCERVRKLLSQLPEAQVTVENLTDAGDMSFNLKRDELSSLCKPLLELFKSKIYSAVEIAGLSINDISSVEVLGGGVRMQVVQAAILECLGEDTVLGAKLDDASVAVGAALFAYQLDHPTPLPPTPTSTSTSIPMEQDGVPPTDDSSLPSTSVPSEEPMDIVSPPPPPTLISESTSPPPVESSLPDDTVGLSPEMLQAAKDREQAMKQKDLTIRALQTARNEMEGFILELRGAPNRKHGGLIDKSALTTLLDDYEQWLWDFGDSAPLDELTSKNSEMRQAVQSLCQSYYQAVEEERAAVERALEEEAKKAEAERAAEGGGGGDEDVDHDFRKLKKADRMRLVVKNKEEGNELWKGGNVRPAAARYHKALTHCAKFFDLSPDDEKEVKQIKLSLYLNLAQCYIKLENWEQTLRNCNDALELDNQSAKAYFRRSMVYEAKKDWEKASTDLKIAEKIAPEDKMIPKALERIKKQIQKEKDKEKKMWGNVFG